MCGIAGVVGRAPVPAARLARMASVLAHRGPDGEGVARAAAPDPSVGTWHMAFVHRRLAVFDPSSAGAQPMTSRSGRTTVVLNGEIYNHRELRRRLPGHPWRTGTDTEVLLELFEALGPGALEHLNGIFAFALWEHGPGRLWLVRDRVGVKPLFYRAGAEGAAFGSELRAVLEAEPGARGLDPHALSQYLDFGFVPAPRTLVRGVRKLAPGTLLCWERGRARIERWWELPRAEPHVAPSWREGLYTRLEDAVRLELRADVPVGTFLSGGIDSTLVTALAARMRPDLETFSARFPECPHLDEGRVARATARTLGTRHHEIPIGAHDVARAAPGLLAGLDEPLADSSLLAVSLLSRAASERVTVVLSGDGADELFAGYRRYAADRWLGAWARVPRPARRLARNALLRASPDRTTRRGEWVRRSHKLLALEGLGEAERAFSAGLLFAPELKRRLAPDLDGVAGAGWRHFRRLRARSAGCGGLDTQLRVDLALALPDDMLVKVDRGSMAHGLEVRVPFLDHRVVEHAARLPAPAKRAGGRGKAALLDVFGAHLPRAVARRPKAGFDAPIAGWLRRELHELVGDALAPGRLRALGGLDPDVAAALRADHQAGRADHSWRLWALAVLSDWSARHALA